MVEANFSGRIPGRIIARHDARQDTTHTLRPGFSLIELLVVVSIIAILISITLPALSNVRYNGWAAVCQSNLHQIKVAINVPVTGKHRHLPSAGGWMDAVRTQGAQDALYCPMGRFDGGEAKFEDAYFTQRPGPQPLGVIFSYLEDIKNGHYNDPQIGVVWKGQINGKIGENGRIGNWPPWAYERDYGRPLDPNDMAITFDDDAAAVVEFTSSPVRVVPVDPPSGQPGQPDHGTQWTYGGDMACGSDHWFGIGQSGPNWQSEILMQLTGNNHKNILDPPVNLTGGSYGMNGLVDDNNNRGSQVLIMDYKKAIVDIEPSGNFIDDFDDWFAPRHFGKAHVMFVDSSIELMSRADLLLEPNIWYDEDLYPPVP